MTKDALIHGKVQMLSDDEKEAAENFHRSRYPFAWINNKLVFNNNDEDDRDHQHWLMEDYGVSIENFEKLNRGYMLPDRIQLFIGSSFAPINSNLISVTDFNTLLHTHKVKYNSTKVHVYNGVKIGKVGEVWEPLQSIGEFDTI